MSKFIFLYRGPARPMDNLSEERAAEQMTAWTNWGTKAGSALTDFGAPFGARTAVADDGTSPAPGDLNGYTIVEADNLAAARALTDQHPYLSESKGLFTVEIFELMPM